MTHKNPRQAKAAEIALVVKCPKVFTIGKIAAVDTDSARYRKALEEALEWVTRTDLAMPELT